MKSTKLPQTDSIEKLAKFWDRHDLTDFQDELEEVGEPVFEQGASVRLRLKSKEAKAVRRMAQAKGVSQAELIREWVVQKLAHRSKS